MRSCDVTHHTDVWLRSLTLECSMEASLETARVHVLYNIPTKGAVILNAIGVVRLQQWQW